MWLFSKLFKKAKQLEEVTEKEEILSCRVYVETHELVKEANEFSRAREALK